MNNLVHKIRELLLDLNSIEKLRELLSELNFEFENEPLSIPLPDSVEPHVSDLRIIAQRNGFNIILCKIDRLLKGSERRIIEQISRVHFHSLIVFTNPEENEWHFINVRLDGTKDEIQEKLKEIGIRRRVFRRLIVGESERLRTASERLAMIEVDGTETALQMHRKINRAFDVQDVTEDFYRDFVQYYKFFRQEIQKTNSINEDQADGYTQTIFNRLFFLYFLQKKKFLEGNPFYFKDKLEQVNESKIFYSEVLIPLFKKLSIPNYKDKRTELIPFLNGGLFEFNDEEEGLYIENWLFHTIINELFERYNFTIREETEWEQEVAIDPEMLGTIFERLILGLESKKFKDIPDPRRASGSYYTPKFIVSFIVKQAILNYLHQKLGKEIPRSKLKVFIFQYKVDGFSDSELEKLKSNLMKIKVVDPGVGSGAFPVDLLLKMVELIENIDRKIEPESVKEKNYRYHLKRKISENNIYGVDIQKRAVDLAHLRLWLSLIVDLEVEKVSEIPPLPNLDFNFYVGDSLKSKIGEYDFDIQRETGVDDKGLQLLDQYRKLKIEYQDLQDKKEKEIQKKKIQKKKRELLEWFFTTKKREIQNQLKSIEKQTKLDFGLPESELPLKNHLLEELEKVEKHLDRLDNLIKEFNWGLDFFEIMELNKGFDAVIGNPPYGVKVTDAVKQEFGLGSKDSYGVFTALGLKILRPSGTLSYIMSDTWQTIRTHKPLRDKLLYETDVQYLIFVPNDTFSATVNPGVYSFVKRERAQKTGGDNWILAADFSPLKICQPDGRLNSSNLEAAFDILLDIDAFDESKDGYTIISDRDLAIYAYRQKLITRYSNHSFFIASPKLFKLMQDVGNVKRKEVIHENGGFREIPVYAVDFNDKELELVKLGDIAEVKQGLATGDNEYYLRQSRPRIPGAARNYLVVDFDLVLTEEEIQKIANNEKIRKKVIDKGIIKSKRDNDFDPDRYFDGRYFVPYDKGGSSDIDEGWLPNYYVPTDYYIDWSEEAVQRMRTLTIKERDGKGPEKLCSRFQNSDYYFKEGISFSVTGIYAPMYKINYSNVFDHKASCIFALYFNLIFLIGILNSKLTKYLIKNYLVHTVESSEGAQKHLLITKKTNDNIETLVKSIIIKQKINLQYNYLMNEQIEIDNIVFNIYNLKKDEIVEIESWFHRRYPKLAKVIEKKLEERNFKENLII